MDKVKKIFSPGSKKDDEVLYGDADERRRESASKAPEQEEPGNLRPVEGSQKKEHSIMRQLINPGGEKYDDQRFGTTATTEAPDPNKLETHHDAPKQHTITDQILNPGGDKYDPQRFEGTATTGGDRRSSVRPEAPEMVGPDTKLETDPAEKKHEHSILRQIINPGGAKYDEEGYGTTAHAAGSLGNQPSDVKDHSVARQILNPGQEKYDPVVHGGSGEPVPSGLQQPSQSTAGAAASSTMAGRDATGGTMLSRSTGVDDSASCLSIKSGKLGPFAREADTGAGSTAPRQSAMTSTTTTTTNTTSHNTSPLADRSANAAHINPVGAPETSAPQAGGSHLGRDAGMAGGAGLAGGLVGAGAYSQLNKPQDDIAGATYTERSQPLAGSSTYNTDPDRAMGTGPIDVGSASTGTQQTGAGTGTSCAHVNPIGAPEESLEGQPRLGQDAALAGGVGAAGVAAGSGVTQLNRAPDDVQQATYTDRSYPVGGTRMTQRTTTDPHLPGEFPMETGEDRHGVNPRTLGDPTTKTATGATSDPTEDKEKQSLGSRILSAVGLSSNKDKDTSGETSGAAGANSSTTEQPSEHHYGRDAAVAGGLVAGGAGADAATRDHDDEGSGVGSTQPSQTTASKTAAASDLATSQPTTGQPSSNESHTGRDAALAGGAGAAGMGAYAASRDRPADLQMSDSTTSKTAAASALATSQPTTGQPTTSTANPTEDHTGRNAALAGGAGVGAGAAGIAAYEASKDTGPASKTYGPHDSNIANIMDPRVKMEPEKMKGSESGPAGAGAVAANEESGSGTAGPYSTVAANNLDPEKDEHHYGRDAAAAGGAGAAGVGAYAAMKDDKPVTSQQTTYGNAVDPATIAARRAGEKEAQPANDKHDKHDKHSKTHNDDNDSGEKKRGLLDKILHPRHKDDKEGRKSEDSGSVAKTSMDSDGHNKLHKKSLGDPVQPSASPPANSGQVIEPHTGLPMDLSKSPIAGAGGTDGARQIEGYHETDPVVRRASMGTAEGAGKGEEGVAGPDWDAIRKANTPY